MCFVARYAIRYDEIRGAFAENGIPNKFNAFNIDQSAQTTSGGQNGYHDQTQSIFGSLEVSYDHWLYLTLTGRNDWASQLANSPQSSFFYPSVGLSGILTDLLSAERKPSYIKHFHLQKCVWHSAR